MVHEILSFTQSPHDCKQNTFNLILCIKSTILLQTPTPLPSLYRFWIILTNIFLFSRGFLTVLKSNLTSTRQEKKDWRDKSGNSEPRRVDFNIVCSLQGCRSHRRQLENMNSKIAITLTYKHHLNTSRSKYSDK